MHALVLCGDTFHLGETARSGLQPLEKDGFEFEYRENTAEVNSSLLKNFPLVVLAKSNTVSRNDQRPWLTSNSEMIFQEHARNGNGLLVIHSGVVGYKSLPAAHSIIGGSFMRHPPECEIAIEPQNDHPITKEIVAFPIYDEHYFVQLEENGPDVFLNSRSEHGVQPAGWTQETELGRVCVLTPGHKIEVWLHPSFQKILLNASRWVAKLT
jgi:uncharacterized protein